MQQSATPREAPSQLQKSTTPAVFCAPAKIPLSPLLSPRSRTPPSINFFKDFVGNSVRVVAEMQSSKSRNPHAKMGEKCSPHRPSPKMSPSKSTRGIPVSSDSSDCRSIKGPERKSSPKSTSSVENRNMKMAAAAAAAAEMLQQQQQQQLSRLQEELRKEKGEKNRALKEIVEMRKEMIYSRRSGNEDSGDGGDNNVNGNAAEMLEKEVTNAKDSERKMLESLVAQTKELEQTKILLEEAKLEIRRSLQESKKSGGNLEEITVLRNELKFATEAEENSKKAMDDLAIALKEVTTEASWVKERFSEARAELEKVRAEAKSSRALFESAEEKLQLACEESKRLKSEAEESAAAWNEKEKGFLNCMKMCQEDFNKAKQEKVKLIESQKVTREENSKLRDVLKQEVNEATVAKEALEIARSENSQLNDLILEKENELQSIKQEFENLKVSEAAAKDEIKELNKLIAATKSTAGKSKLASSSEADICQKPKVLSNDPEKEERPRIQNGRRHSTGDPAKFKVPVLDTTQKEDWFATSLSNVSDTKATSSIATDYMEHEYVLVDGTHLDGMENSVKQKKKKTILRRFGYLLRRSSFRRSNSSSLRSS